MMLLSIIFGWLLIFFLPGYVGLSIGTKKSRYEFDLTDVILLSLAINILVAYLGFLTGFGGALFFQIYMGLIIALFVIQLIRTRKGPALRVEPLVIIPALFIFWIVIQDLGLPVISWDGIFVWEAMADAMSEGRARTNTATYPHGVGALGAIADQAIWAIPEPQSYRIISLAFPVIAIIASVSLGRTFFERLVLAGFASAFLFFFLRGMDIISYAYATSFTSDVFLFTATVIAFVMTLRFCERLEKIETEPLIIATVKAMRSWPYLLLIASIFVAANAKQTGLSYAALPGLAAIFCLPAGYNLWKRFVIGAFLSIPALLVGLCWYAVAVIKGVGATGGSSLQFLLVGVHKGRDLMERALLALEYAGAIIPTVILLIIAIPCVIALLKKRNWIVPLAILPTLLFYLFVSGYAARNVTGVMGGFFVLACLGLLFILNLKRVKLPTMPTHFSLPRHTIFLSMPIIIGLGLLFDQQARAFMKANRMIGSQEAGFRGINNHIAQSIDASDIDASIILTNYRVLDRIALFDAYEVRKTASYKPEVYIDLAGTAQNIHLFIIWPDRAPERSEAWFRCLQNSENVSETGSKYNGEGTQYLLVTTKDIRALSDCLAAL